MSTAPPGGPPIIYTTGHATATVANGKVTSFHLSGHSTNICAALAG